MLSRRVVTENCEVKVSFSVAYAGRVRFACRRGGRVSMLTQGLRPGLSSSTPPGLGRFSAAPTADSRGLNSGAAVRVRINTFVLL